MNLDITHHAAIIQGASKGLGRGIAEALAAEGVDLLLTARNMEALATVAAELSAKHGVRAVAMALDSADPGAPQALCSRAMTEFGRLDILVCNSGGPPPGTLRDLHAAQWIAAAQLLLAAPAMLLKEALPLLAKSPAPRFFVVTSSSSKEPVPGLLLSNSMRPGLVGFIKSIAAELASEHICCHSIAPGRFDTDRLGHVIDMQAKKSGRTPEEVRAAMIAAIPAGRLGDPIDLGNLVAFLASPKASYMTGQNWLVDGGLVRAI